MYINIKGKNYKAISLKTIEDYIKDKDNIILMHYSTNDNTIEYLEYKYEDNLIFKDTKSYTSYLNNNNKPNLFIFNSKDNNSYRNTLYMDSVFSNINYNKDNNAYIVEFYILIYTIWKGRFFISKRNIDKIIIYKNSLEYNNYYSEFHLPPKIILNAIKPIPYVNKDALNYTYIQSEYFKNIRLNANLLDRLLFYRSYPKELNKILNYHYIVEGMRKLNNLLNLDIIDKHLNDKEYLSILNKLLEIEYDENYKNIYIDNTVDKLKILKKYKSFDIMKKDIRILNTFNQFIDKEMLLSENWVNNYISINTKKEFSYFIDNTNLYQEDYYNNDLILNKKYKENYLKNYFILKKLFTIKNIFDESFDIFNTDIFINLFNVNKNTDYILLISTLINDKNNTSFNYLYYNKVYSDNNIDKEFNDIIKQLDSYKDLSYYQKIFLAKTIYVLSVLACRESKIIDGSIFGEQKGIININNIKKELNGNISFMIESLAFYNKLIKKGFLDYKNVYELFNDLIEILFVILNTKARLKDINKENNYFFELNIIDFQINSLVNVKKLYNVIDEYNYKNIKIKLSFKNLILNHYQNYIYDFLFYIIKNNNNTRYTDEYLFNLSLMNDINIDFIEAINVDKYQDYYKDIILIEKDNTLYLKYKDMLNYFLLKRD